jgi:hypothetical protein
MGMTMAAHDSVALQSANGARAATPTLQRACACAEKGGTCARCSEKPAVIQASRLATVDHVSPPRASEAVPTGAASSNGLPGSLRTQAEHRLGADFSSVRVHTDTHAARMNAEMGARAFTLGNDVFVSPAHSDFTRRDNQALMVHELTHVVQQRNGRTGTTESLHGAINTNAGLEAEAEGMAERFRADAPAGRIRGRSEQTPQRDISDTLAMMKNAASGGLNAVADWVANKASAASALISRLNAMRKELQARIAPLIMPPKLVEAMAGVYEDLRAAAPSWLPLPVFKFVTNVQPVVIFIIAGVAVTLEALILFFAFLLVMVYLLQNLDPKTRKARERAVEDMLDKVRELVKPKAPPLPPTEEPPKKKPDPKPDTKPDPKPDPKPEPKTGPTNPIPDEPKNDKPKEYPICWPLQFGPVTSPTFVRTKVEERDLDEQKQARMKLDWRKFRDEDFPAGDLDVHHVVPLFLGGADDLRFNGTALRRSLHQTGHQVLNLQPQIGALNPALGPHLLRHPPGTRYRLAGYKEKAADVCG